MLIQKFEDFLKRFCPHVLDYYNNPLPLEVIDDIMKIMSFDIAYYKAIYSWKNGIDGESQNYKVDLRIDFAGNFISLDEAKQLVLENEQNEYWPNNFLPILATFEGETLLLDIDNSSMSFGRVCFYSPSSSELIPESYYDNIESMLLTIMALFEEHAQWYNHSEYKLHFDFDLRKKICNRMNPNSNRWY